MGRSILTKKAKRSRGRVSSVPNTPLVSGADSKYFDGFLPIDLKRIRPKGFLAKVSKIYEENVQKVTNKHGWEKVNRCPLCSSVKRNKEFSKSGIDYVCCNACGLRYTEKVPKDTEDVYSDEDYLPKTRELLNDIAYRKKRFAQERVRFILDFIGGSKRKSIFDIGCGIGTFLETAAENGFTVYGQDLGKEFAQWVSQRLGVPIYSEPISRLRVRQKFDVITLFDVIEHVPNPAGFILDCKKFLRENGIIVIFTPNFASLAVQVMGAMAFTIAPAEHLLLFTRETVEVLTEKTGLELVYYCTRGLDLGDISSYYEWKNQNQLKAACLESYNEIQPLIDYLGAANHMRFILKKRR